MTAVWNEDRGNGSLPFAHRINRTPCPAVSAGASWGSVLDSAWLTYTGAGADSLYWTLGDGTTASSAPTDTLRHTYAANGTYTGWQYAFRDCGTVDSVSFTLSVSGIGLAESSTPVLEVSPNPAQNWIQHEGPECTNVRLRSSTGHVVEVRSHWRAHEPWNLESLPNGVYHVETDRGWFQFVLFR